MGVDAFTTYIWKEKMCGYAFILSCLLFFRLYEVAQTPDAKGLLDVGIYKNRHWKVKVALVREGLI